MQVIEVCRLTGLTKKAIEYYQGKGLIFPKINGSGYREFSESDLARLQEIAVLRKLDFTIDEMKQVLDSDERKLTLTRIKQSKEIQAKTKLARLELMERLIHGVELHSLKDELDLLDQHASMNEKLVQAFPGYFGKFLSIHFGRFLKEPIKTEEQGALFETAMAFLDTIEFRIPEELQPMMDEADKYVDEGTIRNILTDVERAYENFETYWENNKDTLMQIVEFKKTDEYKNLTMAQFMDLFRKFGETSGYYDVFIPTMRKLCPAYDSYYLKLLEANEKYMGNGEFHGQT